MSEEDKQEIIKAARDFYEGEDIQIDEDRPIVETDDASGYWVPALLWVEA